MSSKAVLPILAGFLGLLAATPAFAGGKAGTAAIAGGADAPGVRAALVFHADPGKVVRSKGVAGMTSPRDGVYCVKVKGVIGNVRQTVPIAVPVREGGGTAETLALASTRSVDCPRTRKWLTVYTYKATDFGLSDDVSWSLIVP